MLLHTLTLSTLNIPSAMPLASESLMLGPRNDRPSGLAGSGTADRTSTFAAPRPPSGRGVRWTRDPVAGQYTRWCLNTQIERWNLSS